MKIPNQLESYQAGGSPFERLIRQVMEANPDVQDVYDVAAVVESCGWTDRQVESAFGYANVFEVSEELYRQIHVSVQARPIPPPKRTPWRRVIPQIVREFLRGVAFVFPMAITVASMILLHISLMAYQYFSLPQATALALATFLSFVATGGFSQSMAMAYYLLMGLQQVTEVERIIFWLMRWGFWTSLVLGAGIWGLDIVFPVLPQQLMGFMVLYMITLSVMWLSFSGLYVLRRETVLTAITGLGVAVVFVLWKYGVPVITAQIFGMFLSAFAGMVASVIIFRKSVIKKEATASVVITRPSQLAYTTGPYFAYGMMYFIFIFIDRIISWTTNTNYMPYAIWFRGQYELGMDWALITLMLPLGAGEVLITTLLNFVHAAEHYEPASRVQSLENGFRRMYYRSVMIISAVALLGWLSAHFFAAYASGVPLLYSATPVQGVEPFVFNWGSGSYVLLAISLFNIQLLFTLAFPRPALQFLSLALGIDTGVGLLATRLFNQYQFAVFGLLAGSGFLAVATTWAVIRQLPRIDYVLYRMT